MLKGIMKLWELGDFQDCWILFRCLLDRLFHLRALADDNAYEVFEQWSFKRQFDARNLLKSDSMMREKLNPDFLTNTPSETQKYTMICRKKLSWRRPEPKALAKKMDLDFLYKYGYDFASTMVHPMANDGQEDYFRQLNLPEKDSFPEQTSVLQNSLLVTKLIIQEGLNDSGLAWRETVFDLLDNVLKYLEEGSLDWLISFKEVARYFEAGNCECQLSFYSFR